MDIIWKPVLNYEKSYIISNTGLVKSLNRVVICKNGMKKTIKETYLKPQKDRYGYSVVNLYKDSKIKTMKIHRLVATCFIPNFENKHHVNHKDLNKSNNNIDNLEWVTSRENSIHYYKNVVNKKPVANRRFSKKDIIKIFEMRKNGFTHSHIAELNNVSTRLIGNILNKKIYIDINVF